jgi:hypothetical protein
MQRVRVGKCKKTGADAVAEVTPRRPANQTRRQCFIISEA